MSNTNRARYFLLNGVPGQPEHLSNLRVRLAEDQDPNEAFLVVVSADIREAGLETIAHRSRLTEIFD